MSSSTNPASYSLQTRLHYAFSLLLFFFLGSTGLVLDSAFRSSIEAGAADRLQVQIYLLLGAAEEEDGEFYFLQDLQEPGFGQIDSGLYGFISSPQRGELWRSDSATALTLADTSFLTEELEVGSTSFTIVNDRSGAEYFVLSYGILWEDGRNDYRFSVVEDVTPYYSEISNFRTSLWSWLGGVSILLLVIQIVLLRWGLSPLKSLESNLKEIENGSAEKLAGNYPVELRGVTRNLNLLIESERKQQTKYRTTLGDLAHSLKTPLAVIVGVVSDFSSENAAKVAAQLDTVKEQVDRMSQIVNYQLQRAVQSQNSSTLAKQVNVGVAVAKLMDALRKVYIDSGIQAKVSVDESASFLGDERDLMEVLGNVIDNGFKYAESVVAVTVSHVTGSTHTLSICVEDDGQGIAQDKREFVLQRGARADTLRQGQGIGLAVVVDIVSSYGGDVTIGTSETLGGAKVQLFFK
ncbi:MAG: two-component system sensor histidine kinase PhoQ [Pseudohongiellaceae bacterium]|jgi:two-component system sensor histidine kinase PhoQ